MPDNEIFNNDNNKIGQKINPVTVPETQIGVDTENEFFKDLAEFGASSSIDITSLEINM